MARWRPVAAIAGIAAAGWFGAGVFRAQRALDEAISERADSSVFRYRERTLGGASAVFEPLASPASFVDAVAFEGRLYVAGSAGLFAYNADGTLADSFRAGIELPSAPLAALSTGLAPDRGSRHLMVATRGQGLLLFDGRAFRQIRPDDGAASRMTSIIALASGRVVFGTETRGVLSWDGRAITLLHPEFSGLHVTALTGDDRELWIGTTTKGALRFVGGEVHTFGESEGLPDPHVLAISQRENTVWAATALGIAEFRDGRFTRRLAEGFSVRSLLPRASTLIAGTLDEGIVEIPLESRPRISQPRASEGPGEPLRLFEFDGRLHALTSSGLYADGTRGSWRAVLKDENARLADRNVAALAADSAGRLWIGYFDSGLEVLDAGGTRVARHFDDRLYCINRIAHDSTRLRSAVATANGLVLFDGDGSPRQVLTRETGLIATHTTDVVFTSDGMIAATPAGLTFLDAGGSRSLYVFHGLVNNHVYALASSGNRVLAGTLGGLSVLESGIVRASFTTANSTLRHNWITAIVPVDDEFFVGTYGAGVMRTDASGRFTRFPDFPPNVEINPGALAATTNAVYAGTLNRGLAVYSRASGRWTFITEGLPSLSVTALAFDRGSLYVGTDNGIVRAPEERLRLP